MKVLIILLTGFLLTATNLNAQSADRNKGLGVILGDPTGVSFAYWTADTRAFAFGAAWSFPGTPSMHFHTDYIFHRYDIFEVNRGSLPLYYGIGGRLNFRSNETILGVRLPLGIAYQFENDPIELFLEIVPVLELVPETKPSGNSGIGIRYYF